MLHSRLCIFILHSQLRNKIKPVNGLLCATIALVIKMKFSKNFETYTEWLISQTTESDYKNRIIRMYNLHPEATLSQLRGHAKTKEKMLSEKTILPVGKRAWRLLSPREKLSREKSLEVLSDMRRNNKSLTKASRDKGISIKTVRDSIRAFKKVGNRWIPKAYDRISRVMVINENGRMTSIEVNDSRIASKIGRYHNAVKKYLETGDNSELRKFDGMKIKDAQGNTHTLETDTDAIDKIAEGIEEPEFYDIYKV